jgi:hypothetical protein
MYFYFYFTSIPPPPGHGQIDHIKAIGNIVEINYMDQINHTIKLTYINEKINN